MHLTKSNEPAHCTPALLAASSPDYRELAIIRREIASTNVLFSQTGQARLHNMVPGWFMCSGDEPTWSRYALVSSEKEMPAGNIVKLLVL